MNDSTQLIWTKKFTLIIIVNLFMFCSFQMLLPTLPIYAKTIGSSNSSIGWILGISTIASIVIRPVSGIILDRIGKKLVLFLGLTISIIVTFSYGWATTIVVILIIRCFHGLGWGLSSTASSTIATKLIPKTRFGEGMGYFSLSTSLAMALAPGIGLLVMSSLGFHNLIYCATGFGLAALFFALFIKDTKKEDTETQTTNIAPYERSSIGPSCIMFFVSASFGALNGFLSLYANERGIDNIGIFFTIYAIVLLLSRPLCGRLTDRYGFQVTVYPGLVLLILAFFILSHATSLTSFLTVAAIYGIGFGMVQSSLQTMSVINAPKSRLGAANATFYTGFDGGIGLGAVLAGFIATFVGYSGMYALFSCSIIIAGILFFLYTRRKINKIS